MPIPPPHWVSFDANKTQGIDLLGLRAPVQAIGNNLLNGLTSVTPKLRYLSVLTWVVWRYAEGRLPDSRPAFMRFAAAQEAAIVMANLVHDRTTLALIGRRQSEVIRRFEPPHLSVRRPRLPFTGFQRNAACRWRWPLTRLSARRATDRNWQSGGSLNAFRAATSNSLAERCVSMSFPSARKASSSTRSFHPAQSTMLKIAASRLLRCCFGSAPKRGR
jgi:hypothetical protein